MVHLRNINYTFVKNPLFKGVAVRDNQILNTSRKQKIPVLLISVMP